MTFSHKIMVAERNNFSSNAEHIFGNGKVISKCNYKIYLPPFKKRGEAPNYVHFIFIFIQFLPLHCYSLFKFIFKFFLILLSKINLMFVI